MINLLYKFPSVQKRPLVVLGDLFLLSLALIGAFFLQMDQPGPLPINSQIANTLLLTVGISILLFERLGFYRSVIRHLHGQKAVAIFLLGISLAAVLLAVLGAVLQAGLAPSIPVLFWCLALLLVGGPRVLTQMVWQQRVNRRKEKVIIYGAGDAGRQLNTTLSQGDRYHPVMFVDDDLNKQGQIIQGLPVCPPQQLREYIEQQPVKHIFLALGDASRAQHRSVEGSLEGLSVNIQTIPDFDDIMTGRTRFTEGQDFELEDLLGRDVIETDVTLLEQSIRGKAVMVTGAGGSMGAELCRQIVRLQPKILVLFELSEFGLYQIAQQLENSITLHGLKTEIKPILGNVQQTHRLQVIMQSFGIQSVYHAAAHKHVPMIERNMIEGVRNNVFGSWHAAEAAMRAKVDCFVLLSSDQAMRPGNIMAMTKRISELVLKGLSTAQSDTRFCVVRFGSVLDTFNAVVPQFKQQIQAGGPVKVTHPEVCRSLVTAAEAARLVIQAGALGHSGEVFTVGEHEPVKIVELARRMVTLMGLTVRNEDNPSGDIEIVYSGLPPGEKLYDDPVYCKPLQATDYPYIHQVKEDIMTWSWLKNVLATLETACHDFDCETVREVLLSATKGFDPHHPIEDVVWQHTQQTASASAAVVSKSSPSTQAEPVV